VKMEIGKKHIKSVLGGLAFATASALMSQPAQADLRVEMVNSRGKLVNFKGEVTGKENRIPKSQSVDNILRSARRILSEGKKDTKILGQLGTRGIFDLKNPDKNIISDL